MQVQVLFPALSNSKELLFSLSKNQNHIKKPASLMSIDGEADSLHLWCLFAGGFFTGHQEE